MTAANAVTLMLITSILLIVFALGARSSFDDATFLFRRPALLIRAMTAIYIVAPAIAIAVSMLFNLSPPVRFALIALSISPVPPVLPNKQLKVGADTGYTIGLLVAASVFALVATPLLFALAARLMDVEASIPIGQVAKTLALTIGVPLALGMLVRAWAPKVATRISGYATAVGTALLLIGLAIVLFAQWRAIVSLIGNGSVLAIAAVVVASLAVGHVLGGTSDGNNAALALATATRHPGVAISMATINFPDQQPLAVAAVLLFFIVNAIVSLPYVRRAKRPAQVSTT